MRIKISETNEIKELTYLDWRTGVDITEDFVAGNELGTRYDDESEAWTMGNETYEWWVDKIKEYEHLDNLISAYEDAHGCDEVLDIVTEAGYPADLHDAPSRVARALIEAFGPI